MQDFHLCISCQQTELLIDHVNNNISEIIEIVYLSHYLILIGVTAAPFYVKPSINSIVFLIIWNCNMIDLKQPFKSFVSTQHRLNYEYHKYVNIEQQCKIGEENHNNIM